MNRASRRLRDKLAKKDTQKQPENQSLQHNFDLARQHYAAGRWQEAETLCQRILRHHPNHPQVLHFLGVLSHQQGKNPQALQWITQAVTIAPDLPKALYHLGIIHQALGHPQEALSCYYRAREQEPDCFEIHNNLGMTLQNLHRHEEAAACFARALDLQPDSFEITLNLAQAQHLSGKLESAVHFYRLALEKRPDQPHLHHALGMVYLDWAKPEPAITAFRHALHLKPDTPETWIELGLALQRAGRWNEAEESFAQALKWQPIFFDPLFHLGNLFMMTGRFATAVDHYRRALKIKNQSVEAWTNLGSAYLKLENLTEAHASFVRALQINPREPGIRTNLGTVLHKMGQSEQALATYRHVLSMAPDFPDALLNLGHAAHESDRLDEAQQAYERALTVRPVYPEAMTGLGIVAHKRGQFAAAVDWFQSALRQKPDFATAHYNESLTRLLTGDYKNGFNQYEWRWQTESFTIPPFPQPPWDSKITADQTILLHCEQGFGDSIQFVRYAEKIQSLGGKVAVFCPPELERLLRTANGINHLTSNSDLLPPCDYQVPFMSLAHRLGTTLENIPAAVPYLWAEDAGMAWFRERLEKLPGLKVGLAWRGNPKHVNDRHRSVTPEVMAALCDVTGCSFINVQKDITADELLIFSHNGNFFDFSTELQDFADTAALLSQLQLVICVDTAVIHLAGAMARPGWLLLPEIADWRWLQDRTDSPWYPSLRLFRQSGDGGWKSVIGQVRATLETWVAKKTVISNRY
ncbi:MAG: glycosyl transferase group 1 [Magnetococcales bacterium]|nr:glycosyl transferase group 1 [Magnetococcales bacterium]HIJ83578.1 tetratricopeptide repeat protein [Magnetococcales bacterium]